VCGLIESEELRDVILCGHSYGGMVITGVADRMRGRIRALAYLDAFLPQSGDSLISLLKVALPPEVAAEFLDYFHPNPDGALPGARRSSTETCSRGRGGRSRRSSISSAPSPTDRSRPCPKFARSGTGGKEGGER